MLNRGRSEFTGWHWALPRGDQPGEWVTAEGQLVLCHNGIHASPIMQSLLDAFREFSGDAPGRGA